MTLRSTPPLTRLALLGVVVGCALLLAAVSPAFALSVAPVLALLAALIAGTFPGEDLMQRIRERRSLPVKRRRLAGAPSPPVAVFVRPTGRRLAFALAMRPPPGAPARA